METRHESLHLDDEVDHSKISLTYLKVLLQSFCLKKLLNLAMLRNSEFMLGQTVNTA
jgi:hypothetical protein